MKEEQQLQIKAFLVKLSLCKSVTISKIQPWTKPQIQFIDLQQTHSSCESPLSKFKNRPQYLFIPFSMLSERIGHFAMFKFPAAAGGASSLFSPFGI